MVELQMLNKVLQEKSDSILTLNDIDETYFVQYAEEYEFIQNHKKQYGNIPDLETFVAQFEDFEVIQVNESNEYLVNSLKEWHLYNEAVPVVQKLADKMKTDSVDAIAYLKQEMPKLTITDAVKGVDIISQSGERFEEWMQTKENKHKFFIETGFKELDEITNGFHRGEELVVLFARTGIGKTWVALKMLEHSWRMNKRVGLLEPEMSANKIGYRFDTLNNHISSKDLMFGNDINGYAEYIQKLQGKDVPFLVSHPRDFKNKVTVSKLKQWCESNKIEILCVDGISYLKDERGQKGDNKTIALTNISEDLMQLSIDLSIPVIVVVQSNRVGDKSEDLDLENIRDSDGIAYNASLVISVQQKEDGLQLKINKARNARIGDKLIYLWEPDKGTFQYIPQASRGEKDKQAAEDLRRKYEEQENEW